MNQFRFWLVFSAVLLSASASKSQAILLPEELEVGGEVAATLGRTLSESLEEALGIGVVRGAFGRFAAIRGQRFIIVVNETKFRASVDAGLTLASMPILFSNDPNAGVPDNFAQKIGTWCENGFATLENDGATFAVTCH